MIYTQSVTVIKDDQDIPKLLDIEDVFQVDVITCAAPYLGKQDEIDHVRLKEIFKSRIKNIFEAASDNGIEVLILGAFGCGAFKNPPEIVAKAFHEVLNEGYEYRFKKIIFAIKSSTKNMRECPNIMAFKSEFSDEFTENTEEQTVYTTVMKPENWNPKIPTFDKIVLKNENQNKGNSKIGIDFGVHQTQLMLAKNGRFIPVTENGKKIPSVFTITKLGECLFGNRALRYAQIHGEKTERLIEYCGYEKKIDKHSFIYDGQYIGTEFFKYLKNLAEYELKESITGAVLVLSNMDIHYRWNIEHCAGKAGLKILRILEKSLAGSIEIMVRDRMEEEIILTCSIEDNFISGVCIENGDGIFEVLSQKELTMDRNSDDIDSKVITMLKTLLDEGNILPDTVNRVMFFSDTDISKEKIIFMVFQGGKKRFVFERLDEQPVIGAAMQAGKWTCDSGIYSEWLILPVYSYSLYMVVSEEHAKELKVMPFIEKNTTFPIKRELEIDIKKNENTDIYILYGESLKIRDMKALAKIRLNKMWTGDTNKITFGITLDVDANGHINVEIENTYAHIRTKNKLMSVNMSIKQRWKKCRQKM